LVRGRSLRTYSLSGLRFPGEGALLRDLLLDWFRKQPVIE